MTADVTALRSIPDGIEPIKAYRAWNFVMWRRGASLLPIAVNDFDAVSPWDGAGSDWVAALCRPEMRLRRDDTPCPCLVASMLGVAPIDCVVCGSPHVAPMEGCTCGFYALKTFSQLSWPFSGSHPSRDRGSVTGRVELAGKVIEHEWGYRAERARIAELIPMAGTELIVTLLAKYLGVAVAPSVRLEDTDFYAELVARSIAASSNPHQ